MKFILIALTVLFSQFALAADYMVIVSESAGINEINKNDLKQVYLGQKSNVSGVSLTPSILPTAFKATQSFITESMGMSRAEFEKYWMEKEMSGQATPPKRQTTPSDMINFIKSNPSFIGVIPSTDTAPAGVKALKVL